MKETARSGPILDSHPPSLQQYGVCLKKVGQIDRGILVFQRLVNLNPDDSKNRSWLASLQLNADHPKDAIATLQPLLQDHPDIHVSELAAAAYGASGNTLLATGVLKQAML